MRASATDKILQHSEKFGGPHTRRKRLDKKCRGRGPAERPRAGPYGVLSLGFVGGVTPITRSIYSAIR